MVHTANNAYPSNSPRHLKILGMNHFGFEDIQQSANSDWDYNDLTVRISVI
jgi:hypothetical protein